MTTADTSSGGRSCRTDWCPRTPVDSRANPYAFCSSRPFVAKNGSGGSERPRRSRRWTRVRVHRNSNPVPEGPGMRSRFARPVRAATGVVRILPRLAGRSRSFTARFAHGSLRSPFASRPPSGRPRAARRSRQGARYAHALQFATQTAGREGFEPSTAWLRARRSKPLSYRPYRKHGDTAT